MRKSLVLLAIAVACAAAAATFVAHSGATSNNVFDQPPAAHSGPYDYVVGGAERSADVFAARHVALSAHNGPRGATGEFTSQTPTFTFTSDVTCLRVDGNRAVIGAIVRQSAELPDLQGLMVFAAFEDNGNPSDPTPDRVSAYIFDVPGGTTCDAATVLYGTLAPVTSGNININS
jgi:hypothetical protein